MASVDALLSRRRRPGYDCLDFLAEAWLIHCGEDLRGRLDRLFTPDRAVRAATGGFRRIVAPEDRSLVVMLGRGPETHVGLYLRERVLHLLERAEFTELEVASRGFTKVRFYK